MVLRHKERLLRSFTSYLSPASEECPMGLLRPIPPLTGTFVHKRTLLAAIGLIFLATLYGGFSGF